jgi:hypothetical protein
MCIGCCCGGARTGLTAAGAAAARSASLCTPASGPLLSHSGLTACTTLSIPILYATGCPAIFKLYLCHSSVPHTGPTSEAALGLKREASRWSSACQCW